MLHPSQEKSWICPWGKIQDSKLNIFKVTLDNSPYNDHQE